MAEGKLMLAGLQREFVAGQARDHAVVCRPDCRICGVTCRVKVYHVHKIATLFGAAPRFCCAKCGGTEAGNKWPSHCRSTPELDRLQAHLSAPMPYLEAVDVLTQMLPPDAGKGCETLRRHSLTALDDYLTGQSDWMVNYAERHRAGLRVGTAITEGTANSLVNRRMEKSQSMRWSRQGADLLLQIRCAVYNGTLGSGFGQKFYPANDQLPQEPIGA
jgi:hypothetical protein